MVHELIYFLSIPVLPVMLSSKLLPEMEIDDNSKREQLLLGMQNLPVSVQIEKLKVLLVVVFGLSFTCVYLILKYFMHYFPRLELI